MPQSNHHAIYLLTAPEELGNSFYLTHDILNNKKLDEDGIVSVVVSLQVRSTGKKNQHVHSCVATFK